MNGTPRKWPPRVWRWIYKATRPSSYPYISGDGFRNLAHYVYDETNRHLPASQVGQGDIVFVATHYARAFFDEVDPLIKTNYCLITHNSDLPADEALISGSSGKILCWFAQNNTWSRENVVPIPIGLENLHHYTAGLPEYYRQPRAQDGNRKNRFLIGFSVETNARERRDAHESASRSSCADHLHTRLGQREYLRKLVTYKFVLSPPGNGLDTHRTWEAMYLGVVPIVKDSVAMRSFEELGLPLWIVHDWQELESSSESDLEAKYEDLKGRFSAPALFMNYWRHRILRHRALAR